MWDSFDIFKVKVLAQKMNICNFISTEIIKSVGVDVVTRVTSAGQSPDNFTAPVKEGSLLSNKKNSYSSKNKRKQGASIFRENLWSSNRF